MDLSYDQIVSVLFVDGIEQYVPDGLCHSMPVPGMWDGVLTDHFFLFTINRKAGTVEAPLARLGVDADHKKLMYYHHTKETPFITQPDGPMLMEEREKKIEALRQVKDVYGGVRKFAFSNSINDTQRVLLGVYLSAFLQAADKPLRPYYVELSPEFFLWANKWLT